MFCGEFLQQLFQRLEADCRLVAFVKQNDCAGNNRSFDAFNNSAGIIDLGVKRPGTPADQLEAARRQNRMQERILQPGRRTKPDRRGYADRRDCRFEFVNFPRESSWTKPPETESWMGLSVISDRMARLEYHAGQLRIFGCFCTDQKKRRASVVLFQQREDLRRCARVGSVVNGQPSCFRGGPIFGQDRPEALQRWDNGNGHQQQMRGEQNVKPPEPSGCQQQERQERCQDDKPNCCWSGENALAIKRQQP